MTLLPANATPLENAILTAALQALSLPVEIGDLWNPATCPAQSLPNLAWSLSVDDWDADWPEERKREVIAASIALHRSKGTASAVRRALKVAGLGDAELNEQFRNLFWDGAAKFDGSRTFEPSDHWAEYRVRLSRPITVAQAEAARRILDATAPARCHLKILDFVAVQNLFDGAVTFDGSYNFGGA